MRQILMRFFEKYACRALLWLLLTVCVQPWTAAAQAADGDPPFAHQNFHVWANRSVVIEDFIAVPQSSGATRLFPLNELDTRELDRELLPAYHHILYREADAGDPGFWPTDPPIPESAIVPVDPDDDSGLESTWGDRLIQGFGDAFQEWTSRISLGARSLSGNSKQNFIDFAADFEKKVEKIRFTQINLQGQFGESGDTVVANRWFANSTTDFYHGEQWLTFIKIMDQYDQLQNLDYRGTFSGGAGYRFFFEDHRRLVFRVGPGVTTEFFHSPSRNRTTPDMFSEVELRLPLWDRLKWEQKTTIFPSLSALDVSRATSQTSFLYAFDEKERWSLKLGFLYQYISEPNPGRLPNDFTTNLSIVYLRK